MPQFKNFEEFWLYYMVQHSKATTRAFHFIGTTGALVCLVLAFILSPWWLVAGLLAGYGPAWFSHFAIEQNKPATFSHPFWSLRGDLRMYRLMWAGEMESQFNYNREELRKLYRLHLEHISRK